MDKSYIANIFYNMIKANEITIDKVPNKWLDEVKELIAGTEENV